MLARPHVIPQASDTLTDTPPHVDCRGRDDRIFITDATSAGARSLAEVTSSADPESPSSEA
jgi:hypothetical protein